MRNILSRFGNAGCAAQVAGAEGWQSHQASFQSCLTHFCSPGKVSAAVQAFAMTGPLLCIAACFPAVIAAASLTLERRSTCCICLPTHLCVPCNVQQFA